MTSPQTAGTAATPCMVVPARPPASFPRGAGGHPDAPLVEPQLPGAKTGRPGRDRPVGPAVLGAGAAGPHKPQTLSEGSASEGRSGEAPAAPGDEVRTSPGATLRQELRAARLRAGLSLSAIQKRTGITGPLICNYEFGRHDPGLHNLTRWAGALGYDVVLRRRP